MKLIPNWKQAYKLFSAQAHAFQAAIVGTWLSLPDSMRAYVPAKWVVVAVGIAGVLGLAGRLIDQSKSDASNQL